MRKAIRATLLILTLSFSAYAGDMPNGVLPDPTPTPEVRAAQGPTEIIVDDPPQSTITTAEITLKFVQLVLALF